MSKYDGISLDSMHWFQSQLLTIFTHVYLLSFLFSMFIPESSCICHEHSRDQGKGQEQHALDISECNSFLAPLKSSAASNVRSFASNANKSRSTSISSFLLGKNSSEASEAWSRALDTQRQRWHIRAGCDSRRKRRSREGSCEVGLRSPQGFSGKCRVSGVAKAELESTLLFISILYEGGAASLIWLLVWDSKHQAHLLISLLSSWCSDLQHLWTALETSLWLWQPAYVPGEQSLLPQNTHTHTHGPAMQARHSQCFKTVSKKNQNKNT